MTDTAAQAPGTPADQRTARWQFLRAQGELADSSTIRLFPFGITGQNRSFVITRIDTGSTIETSDAGVTCIQLLHTGAVGAARRALAAKYKCAEAEVDIAPLLDCLVTADFIDSVDDYPLSTSPAASRSARRAALLTPLWAPFAATAARRLPLQLALPLVHRKLTRRDPRMLGLIGRHVQAFPIVAGDEAAARAVSCANLDAIADHYLDRLLITLLPSDKLHRWFTRFVDVTGVEHLERAVASGRGALLCGFHTGSCSMLAFVLAAHGHAVSLLSGMGDTGQESITRRLVESRADGYDYPLTQIEGRNPARPMMRTLQRGGAVVMLVDSGVVPLEHTVEVEFLGRRLRAAKGAAWLAERTGAALLPTAMFQRAHGRHTVIIAPEAAAHGADAEERVRSATAAVFRVLESHVRREPAQWLKWKDLPAFYSPEAQPDV